MNKSIIKNKKAIPWGQVIVIKELVANPDSVQMLQNNLKTQNPKITNEELQQQVYQLVLRDNYYNRVMDLIANCYEVDFNSSEILQKVELFKQNQKNVNSDHLQQIAKLNIIKELIYDDLKNEWKIQVTDDQVKESLNNYYKATGQSIREYLNNRDRFEEVKQTLYDQIISDRILNAFKPDFQLEEFNKKMAEQAKQDSIKKSS